jgi:acyl-CoA synthetase (AMP-forming)/AMP-acid ligase II
MDWDTNRYLECFFAVPMMGAVLHMVNVRLSAEQILYTINHAEDDVILINSELLALLQQIWDRVDAGKKLVLLSDIGKPTQTVQTSLSFFLSTPNTRRCLPLPSPGAISRTSMRTPRNDVLHDWNHRAAEGRLLQSQAAGAAHAIGSCRPGCNRTGLV